jgi:uncharacterized membrane protein HdeD (DUF308 family)
MSQKSDVTGSITFGVVFILVGALVLLNEFDVVTITWAYLLPIVLITAGIAVLVSSQLDRDSGR